MKHFRLVFISEEQVENKRFVLLLYIRLYLFDVDLNIVRGWRNSTAEPKVRVLVLDEWDVANCTVTHKSCCMFT